jgi:hypothetical protein
MNNEGESIIEEYLVLVKEKLPESIADDVISELRSYMHESAREKGDGEITVQSAKKIVAQFGAPGEVADEYRYSMFPETIPEEASPKDTIQEMQHVIQQEPSTRTKPILTPIPHEDPSVSYRSFFLTTSLQSIIWIVLISLLTIFFGAIGFPGWTLLIPVSQAGLVIGALFLHSINLRWNKTILWRRAYREWSALQNYVTLPENSVPEMGRNVLRLDALTSLLGIMLIVSASLLSSPIFFLFCGVPISALLGVRIYYRAMTFRDDKDPIRNSRKQFTINIALLVGLNASLFWIFNPWGYWSYTLATTYGLLFLLYIISYGSVLLMNIVTGAQNLWWKTEKEPKKQSVKPKQILNQSKADLLARLPLSMRGVFSRVTAWIVVYNLVQIWVSFDHASFDFISSEYYSWTYWLLIEIASAGAMLALYFLYRRFMIKNLNSNRIFGQRTRIEAMVDLIVSSVFLVLAISQTLASMQNTYANPIDYIILYQRHLGFRWAMIFELMQIIVLPLATIALSFRIFGDILEFRLSWKKKANGLIEQSSVLLVIAIAVFIGIEYLQWIAIYHWYGAFFMSYLIFLPLMLFLAFQIGSSSLKGKLNESNGNDSGGISVKSNNVYSSIAN